MTSEAQQTATRLGVELEAKLLQRLGAEWRHINYTLFKSALRPPVIGLTDSADPLALAAWRPELRSLELSRRLVLDFAWVDVVETLKRLAVEQFVSERLDIAEHRRGPTYRRICRRLGVHPVPLEQPRARELRSAPSERVLGRVRKLLALAGSPNRHEAETAALTAQRLMLKFNLEREQLDAPADDPRRGYGYRHLGPPVWRVAEHDQRLAKILAEHFFVETAWLPIYLPRRGLRATVLEVCGLELNLEMAEHVHAFLRATSLRLWSEYRQATSGCSEHDRPAYFAGVLHGFEAKLAAQQAQLEAEGLVWVPAPELGTYFRQRNPQLRYVAGLSGQRNAAYEHGSVAGQRIVLAPPVTGGSKRAGPAKALGRGRR